ncbi:MAG: type II toxin-antitoxin system VapC family toxin [Thermoleophilaceae bacterium]|nr:type II toxin-antitoxin system VapC family toxin [Thermoleophilaceae bacterium]
MLVYLDSSALLKRVILEDHSRALRKSVEALEFGANELLTSTLGWIEVSRSLQRRFAEGTDGARGDLEAEALSGIAGFPISYDVVSVARRIGAPTIRSLDAIHCATATLAEADILISYDKKMIEAAATMGLAVDSPGVST